MSRLSLLLVCLVLGAGCVEEVELPSTTPIPQVLAGEVADGTELSVRGTVTEVTGVLRPKASLVELTSGGGTLQILTKDSPPSLGEDLVITGTLRLQMRVGGVDRGTVLVEQSRLRPPRDASNARWVWGLAIGTGVILLLLVVLLFRRRARKARERESELSCGFCGAPVEPDWMVCAQCGRPLQDTPSAPQTLIWPSSEGDPKDGRDRPTPPQETVIRYPDPD